jgi:hypothetical protein
MLPRPIKKLLIRQPAFAVHLARAAAFWSARCIRPDSGLFETGKEPNHWNAARFAKIERFKEINAPLTKFRLRNEGFRLPQHLRERDLVQARFLADFAQEGTEAAISWGIFHAVHCND